MRIFAPGCMLYSFSRSEGKHALKTEGHLGMWKKPLTNALVLYLCFNVYEAILISLPSVYIITCWTFFRNRVLTIKRDPTYAFEIFVC